MKRYDNGACAFGQTYTNELRHRRPPCGDKRHLDEVMLTIRGQKHYLWQAVDQYGNVLDILVQSRRNKHAAKRFFRKLLKGLCYGLCCKKKADLVQLGKGTKKDPPW